MAQQKRQQGRPKRAVSNEVKEEPQKVVEVVTKKSESTITKTPPKPSEVRKKTFTVFVKGNAREVSKMTYDAIKNDPKLNVTLPKGSPLVEPEAKKPCKDC
jgi:hypothetical protein